MSKLSSFLKKFVPEYKAIGEALGSLVVGIALGPVERAKVQNAVDMVQLAADNIEKSLAKLPVDEGMTKAQVTALVSSMLASKLNAAVDKAIEQAVNAAVAKALEAATKP